MKQKLKYIKNIDISILLIELLETARGKTEVKDMSKNEKATFDIDTHSCTGREKLKGGKIMKKLTKKQHRGIIRDLINENQSVQNLRSIQRVAEIFEEEANITQGEGTLITADCIRLLLNLINENKETDVEKALWVVHQNIRHGDEWDNLYDDIYYLMNKLDDTRLRHVYFFIRGLLGIKFIKE